jgi:hypothetical protein
MKTCYFFVEHKLCFLATVRYSIILGNIKFETRIYIRYHNTPNIQVFLHFLQGAVWLPNSSCIYYQAVLTSKMTDRCQ